MAVADPISARAGTGSVVAPEPVPARVRRTCYADGACTPAGRNRAIGVDEMQSYEIGLRADAHYTVTVQAHSEDDAIDQAMAYAMRAKPSQWDVIIPEDPESSIGWALKVSRRGRRRIVP